MPAHVRDLILVLQTFFRPELLIQRVLSIIQVLPTLWQLLQLHAGQLQMPRQRAETGWLKAAKEALRKALTDDDDDLTATENRCLNHLSENLENLCHLLDLDEEAQTTFIPLPPPPILVTTRLRCFFCADQDDPPRFLQKRFKTQTVRYIDEHHIVHKTMLAVAHCRACLADYYPDRFTFRNPNNAHSRLSQLEQECVVLRISKSGVWVHRKVALTQEKAIFRMRVGWSNYADYLNDTHGPRFITARQSRRMFLEHMGRRLLLANGTVDFRCPANTSPDEFCCSVVDSVGRNGGQVPGAHEHGCNDCAHEKRYLEDLIEEGVILGAANRVADGENEEADPNLPLDLPENLEDNDTVPNPPPLQDPPQEDGERGYVRCCVMDGKTIGHRICAVPQCRQGLMNYRDGRFCAEHIDEYKQRCGILSCNHLCTPGSLVCNHGDHRRFYKAWQSRFKRLSYSGVRRVMNLQQDRPNNEVPNLNVELPDLDGITGHNVAHTFRAKSVYCIQTVQWACGIPIGWGKCYDSESRSQVLAILEAIWEDHMEHKPSICAYDNACNLLRHIVSQDPDTHWLITTRFIVDVWHYIGHRVTDRLCRLWCNPAPLDGTQPDLIIPFIDDNGTVRMSRAFNTETAEQFNSWLNGFEAALRQMTDSNFDLFMHSLMLMYKEAQEAKIQKRGRNIGPF